MKKKESGIKRVPEKKKNKKNQKNKKRRRKKVELKDI
jgi:hypothetical protein